MIFISAAHAQHKLKNTDNLLSVIAATQNSAGICLDTSTTFVSFLTSDIKQSHNYV